MTLTVWEKISKEIWQHDLTGQFFIDELPFVQKSFLGGKNSAQRTCASSRLIGYSDWRVPTAEEMLNVVRPNSKGKLRSDENIIDSFVADGATYFWTSNGIRKGSTSLRAFSVVI